VAFIVLAGVSIHAQDITIRAVNGKTGESLTNQRLLIFLTDDSSNPQAHNMSLITDELGVSRIKSIDVIGRYLQVWVDGATQCVAHPNHEALDVQVIRANGLASENNCSKKLQLTTKANELIVCSTFHIEREDGKVMR
jgi:hypothetical protein